MSTTALTIDGLHVDYQGRPALIDVSFEVPTGTSVAVIGPNGSGKTTLLHAVAGLVDPGRGRVDRHGHRSSLVLQSTSVDGAVPITVLDTVTMARYPHRGLLGRFRRSDRDAVDTAMERLDIADLARRQLHDLSGGQRQRVLVAQGLAQEAPVLLLDEPVNGLDLLSQERILAVIDEERDAGRTVLLTTHDLDDARRCDLVLLLATCALAYGPPDDVIVEDALREAFGGHVLRTDDGFLMDDPHHHAH